MQHVTFFFWLWLDHTLPLDLSHWHKLETFASKLFCSFNFGESSSFWHASFVVFPQILFSISAERCPSQFVSSQVFRPQRERERSSVDRRRGWIHETKATVESNSQCSVSLSLGNGDCFGQSMKTQIIKWANENSRLLRWSRCQARENEREKRRVFARRIGWESFIS